MKFFFGIPLRSKETTPDWQNVVNRLRNTIESIYDSNIVNDIRVTIVVCGHEVPFFLEYREYANVIFLESKDDIPVSQNMYMQDKNSKKEAIVDYVASKIDNNEEVMFMFLDADDIVSIDFIENTYNFFKDTDIDDMVLMKGYMYDFKRGTYSFLDGVNKKFYRNCGSCFVSRITKDIAIDYLKLLRNHVYFPDIAISRGRYVKESLEPDILYLVNHGTNNSTQMENNENAINSVINSYKIDTTDITHRTKTSKFLINNSYTQSIF